MALDDHGELQAVSDYHISNRFIFIAINNDMSAYLETDCEEPNFEDEQIHADESNLDSEKIFSEVTHFGYNKTMAT